MMLMIFGLVGGLIIDASVCIAMVVKLLELGGLVWNCLVID